MKIVKIHKSRISEVNFLNLTFGEEFTDHMFVCDYEKGKWINPKIIPYEEFKMSPSSSVLHYGQSIFEGMKAYKDGENQVFMFRPEENFKRLNKSAKRLSIPEFPKNYFFEALEILLNIDKNWIIPGIGNSLYIRPFVFANQASVQASPANKYKFLIICTPVKAYYSNKVNVLIAEKYSRAANGGVGFAKAAGNYAAQFYPTSLAQKKGYEQIIWTDANNHEYLEEAGTMNIFFRIGEDLITAPNNDRILDGVTRKSIIELCEYSKIKIQVRPITIKELLTAHKDNSLKEIFGSGTAVVILPIKSFSYKNIHYKLFDQKDPISEHLKKKITDIQYNISKDPFKWRYKLPNLTSLK
jgi:branched-chain amino acid aminotransferase